MDKEIIKIISNYNLLISESDENSDALDAKFVICDFYPNKNDVMLNRNTIDDWISTLEIKPLVGKVVVKSNGDTDFSGHNVKIVKKIDEDGKEYQDVEFDTSAFGSFYKSSIESINDKEYIVASAKVWKRFSQAYDVIMRRVKSAKGIKTSWEIQVLESHYENINGKQIKVIDKGIFIGHCLLGENIEPAYDSSGLLQVATTNEIDTELAEALASDIQNSSIQNSSNKEDKRMSKNKHAISALTTRDLYQKAWEALNPKGWNSNPYYCVWEVYPEEHKILAYDIDRLSDDEYMVFTYTVTDDVVTVGEGTVTKLSKILSEKTNINISLDLNDTAKLLSEKEMLIKSLKAENENLSTQLSEKNDALVSVGEKVEHLMTQVSELLPFKEKVEAIEKAEKEKAIAQKKDELKKYALKGGYISEEEIETSEEIKSLIENFDEKGIKAIIAERVIKKLEENSSIETSQHNTTVNFKTNINLVDEELVDYKTIMSSFLKNN